MAVTIRLAFWLEDKARAMSGKLKFAADFAMGAIRGPRQTSICRTFRRRRSMRAQTHSNSMRWFFLIGFGLYLGVLAWVPLPTAHAQQANVALVNAASYDQAVAPGS